jgi:Gp157 protein
MNRFQQFCEAHGEKADRIGRFLRMMDARVQYCRGEAVRLQDRARTSERKADQTKSMVLYYLKSRDLKRIEGREFTLRLQKNSQDSVRVTDDTQIPMVFKKIEARVDGGLWERVISALPEELSLALATSIRDASLCNDAIKAAVSREETVPGAEVYRGEHLRVA